MKRFRQLISFLLLFVLNIQVFGNTVVDPNAHQNTNVTHSQNGVEVININTPTDRGVSVNTFQEYNVDQNGQIINNATGVGRSHLGGLVNPNNNLAPGQEARTVIFQVNGSNRSNIEGYIEALSPHGINLFIANENGIYANGAGFINIDRAVLTTGRLNLRGDGSVDTISVRNGVITIGPAGFDASRTNYMAMISRTQELHGKIVAGGELTLVSGTNDVAMNDIETQLVNAVTVSGAKPELAIDGSAFGAMYAGQIKIMATELGVGVKSDAVIYAENGGIEILANGDVVVNKLQGNNINVVGTNYEQTGVAYTQGNMNISALTSKILGEGTQVIGNLNFTGSLDNRADMQTNGKLTIGGNLNNIANISSIGNMDIFGNILNDTGSISTKGSLLSTGSINNLGNILADGTLQVSGNVDNGTGIIQSTNNFIIGGYLSNTGEIKSSGNLSLGGSLSNTGDIRALGTLTTTDFNNSDNVLIGSSITTSGSNFQNTGKVSTDNLSVTATNITNTNEITIAENINLIGTTLNNTGNMTSKNITYTGNDFTNAGIGKILTENLSVNATNNIVNSSNITVVNNANLSGITLNNQGSLTSKDSVFTINNITNTGDMLSEGNIITTSNTISNQGRIASNIGVDLNSTNLVNSGTIQSGNINAQNTIFQNTTTGLINGSNVIITSANNLTLDGKIVGSDNLHIRGQDISNSGELISSNTLTLDGNNVVNNGKLLSGQDITLNVASLINNNTLASNNSINITTSIFQNNNSLESGNISVTANDILNSLGSSISGNNVLLSSVGNVGLNGTVSGTNEVNIYGASITNTGLTIGTNKLNLVSSNISNTGRLLSEGDIYLNNTNLVNTGEIASNNKVDILNSALQNSGSIESTNINLNGLISYNNTTGTINGNNVSLTTLGDLNLTGKLIGSDSLNIQGRDIYNNGITASGGNLTLTGRDIINNTELSGLNVTITGTGTLTNNDMITGETGDIRVNHLLNKDLIAFEDNLYIETNTLTNIGTTIYSDNILNIKAVNIDNTDGEIVGQQKLDITGFNTLNNTKGLIESRGDILLSGTNLLNIGDVSGQYRLYWENWDGERLYDTTWRDLYTDEYTEYSQLENHLDDAKLIHMIKQMTDDWRTYNDTTDQGRHGLAPTGGSYAVFLQRLKDFNDTFDYSSKAIEELLAGASATEILSWSEFYGGKTVLTGGVDTSRLVTTGGKIISGGNLTLDVVNLTNKNSKISSGGTLTITDKAATITNTTDVKKILVFDGWEAFDFGMEDDNDGHPLGYGAGIKREINYYYDSSNNLIGGRDHFFADGVSVIEGLNIQIDGDAILSNGYDYSDIKNSFDPNDLSSGKTLDYGAGRGNVNLGGANNATTINGVTTNNELGTINVDRSAINLILQNGYISFNQNAFNDSLSRMFTASSDPSSKYIMETRSKYVDLSNFYGSDYFFDRLGFNPDSDWNKAKRLGDAYYETKYLNNLLLETLGTRFINGKADTALIKDLLDNSTVASKDLQLSVGVALSKDQIQALKTDMIWYVYEEVNGEQVLVPQVYLSKATLENIDAPKTTISAQENLTMNASDLTNAGRISGNKVSINAANITNKSSGQERAVIVGTDVTLVAKNDIINIGSTISAENNLGLLAGGDIVNETSVRTDITQNKKTSTKIESVESIALISAGGNLTTNSTNFTSKGAITEAEGNVDITASNDVNIESLSLNSKAELENGRIELNEKKGSNLAAEGNITITAGNNVNVKGSKVLSDETISIDATNINILNEKESLYTESHSSSSGFLSSSSKTQIDYVEGSIGSMIGGNNVNLNAKNDITIQASQVIALKDEQGMGGNIKATAGNNINILADSLDETHFKEEKKTGFSSSLSVKGGGASVGVSYGSTSSKIETAQTTIVTSSIISEGNTELNAQGKVRTEALQANIGGNLTITGKQGIELLDAQETFSEKIQEKSTTIGVTGSIGSTIGQFVSTANGMSTNNGKYGVGNTSQIINSLGDGITLGREGIKAGADASQLILDGLKGNISTSNLKDYGVSASITASINKSSFTSTTNSTTSVAGKINVGGNMSLTSDGNVTLVNQKVNVGGDLTVDASSFEVLAGVNTHDSNSSSKSSGISGGYDLVNKSPTAGINVSKGSSNSSGTFYDNSTINVGGEFNLTTKGDATFKGANVIADELDFKIGGNLTVESLQDEYTSSSSNTGMNLSLSVNEKIGDTAESLTGGINHSTSKEDSKWVNNQTSLVSKNGGSISVGETLTNKGGIIGSLNADEKLSISAKEVIVEHIEDYSNSSTIGIGLSGIGKDTKVPQTSLQYGSHDKEQDTNSTFVNVVVTENGQEINIADKGANTDLSQAQVITRDETFDMIDTNLHTDLGNQQVRDQIVKDLGKMTTNIKETGEIIDSLINKYDLDVKKDLSFENLQNLKNKIENGGVLTEREDKIAGFLTEFLAFKDVDDEYLLGLRQKEIEHAHEINSKLPENEKLFLLDENNNIVLNSENLGKFFLKNYYQTTNESMFEAQAIHRLIFTEKVEKNDDFQNMKNDWVTEALFQLGKHESDKKYLKIVTDYYKNEKFSNDNDSDYITNLVIGAFEKSIDETLGKYIYDNFGDSNFNLNLYTNLDGTARLPEISNIVDTEIGFAYYTIGTNTIHVKNALREKGKLSHEYEHFIQVYLTANYNQFYGKNYNDPITELGKWFKMSIDFAGKPGVYGAELHELDAGSIYGPGGSGLIMELNKSK